MWVWKLTLVCNLQVPHILYQISFETSEYFYFAYYSEIDLDDESADISVAWGAFVFFFAFWWRSSLLLIMMYTIKFRIPPVLQKVVKKWKSNWGTLIGLTYAHTPNTAAGHHWTKNATTKSDMFLAAVKLADINCEWSPRWRRFVSLWILIHVRVYRIVFITRTRTRGTVVKRRLAMVPFTPSK